MASYLRLYTNGSNDSEGYKINASILADINVTKGITTTELTLPGSAKRSLFPTSGLVEDIDIEISLLDDGTNKAFQITSTGVELDQNKISVKDQYKFLIEKLFSTELSHEHEVYIDYLDMTFVGILNTRMNLNENDFFVESKVNATLKVGTNVFGLG